MPESLPTISLKSLPSLPISSLESISTVLVRSPSAPLFTASAMTRTRPTMLRVISRPRMTASATATRITAAKVTPAVLWIWVTWALACVIWFPTSTSMSSRSAFALSFASVVSSLARWLSLTSARASLAAWFKRPGVNPLKSCSLRAISSSATFSNSAQLTRNCRVRFSTTLPFTAGSTPSFLFPSRMIWAWLSSVSRFMR